MASLPRVIDIEDGPELERIVSVVREGQEALVLRQHGEEVALISPLPGRARRRRKRIVTEAELEAVRAAAIHHDLTLATRNLRHYERIPGLKLLISAP